MPRGSIGDAGDRIGTVGVEKIGLHTEPHRRCAGDVARSCDSIWEAWSPAQGGGLMVAMVV
eukprot:9236709-Pyramimonas_sp.AAC.1